MLLLAPQATPRSRDFTRTREKVARFWMQVGSSANWTFSLENQRLKGRLPSSVMKVRPRPLSPGHSFEGAVTILEPHL